MLFGELRGAALFSTGGGPLAGVSAPAEGGPRGDAGIYTLPQHVRGAHVELLGHVSDHSMKNICAFATSQGESRPSCVSRGSRDISPSVREGYGATKTA